MPGLGFITWIAGSRVGRWISTALAGAALGLALLWKLRRSIRNSVELEHKVDRLEGAIKADERMDHADIGAGASDDDNREWLRERGTRRSKPRS